jgi:Alpha/beta hydrolase of unknown function (DUF900)
VAASPSRDAFIFVHGYNVSFPDAARRTAQIAFDLHIPAPGALVPNQTWFVTGGGDTHDFDHLNRFASRAGRHIVGMNSLFFLRHERSPMSCCSRAL